MPKEFSKVHYLRFYDRDEETYKKLVKLAEKHKRSGNAEILFALEEYVDRQDKDKKTK